MIHSDACHYDNGIIPFAVYTDLETPNAFHGVRQLLKIAPSHGGSQPHLSLVKTHLDRFSCFLPGTSM